MTGLILGQIERDRLENSQPDGRDRTGWRTILSVIRTLSLASMAASTPSAVSASTASTFDAAQKTNVTHVCRFTTPPSFGEEIEFRVVVRGRDFSMRETNGYRNVSRIGQWSAEWPDGAEAGEVQKLNLRELDAAYLRRYKRPFPGLLNRLVSLQPPPDAPCESSRKQALKAIPNHAVDITDRLIAIVDAEFERNLAVLRSLPFTPHLPDLQTERFEVVRGYARSEGYSVEFASTDDTESSQLSISFRGVEPDEKTSPTGDKRRFKSKGLTKQRKTKKKSGDRDHELRRDEAGRYRLQGRQDALEHCCTSPAGRRISIGSMSFSGSSRSQDRILEYHVEIEDMEVLIRYPHWSRRADATPQAWSHDFGSGELEALVDSLAPVTVEDIIRFPGMVVLQ